MLIYKDHPLLPASAPTAQAHIFEHVDMDEDISEEEERRRSVKIEFCDLIATFLSNLEKHPDALANFFDPKVKSFMFRRKYVEGEDGGYLPIMISRKGKEVVCGFYQPIKDGKEVFWEDVSRSKLSHVAPDAVWRTFWGAYEATSSGPIEEFRKTGFYHVNMGYPYENPRKREEAKARAKQFARFLFRETVWEEREDMVHILNVSR
ncbi:hypothetical protein EK21DRAFT_108806 [Setomelanomma holmii]|uniref:Uncharacterized protein n=1 Tax=Setomelanomma holmii TaxID=210430 RepID=A0A9P4LRF5_9PLEO|nr:hypothetical protein EK21DRAFT_108806 [Setomelanomma holmii]